MRKTATKTEGMSEATQGVFDAMGDWPMIESQLPVRWRELAHEQGLITRNPPPQLHAKITDMRQILPLVLFYVATNSSLRVTTVMAAAAEIVDISAVSLHLWMRKLGGYLETLLGEMASAKEVFAPQRWAGYDIRAVDATTITRPGACGTTARVLYALQLTNLRPEQVQATDEHGGETFRRFDIKRGQLWIGDRAYSNPPGIAKVLRAGADVLVRHNRGTLPLYDARGEPIDVLKQIERVKKVGRPKQWSV